jgi:hypothetical protein
MPRFVQGRLVVILAWIVVAILVDVSHGVAGEPSVAKGREKIGEVLRKPVYRDEIHVARDHGVEEELHRLFLEPVTERYCEAHRAEFEPTQAEIDAVIAFMKAVPREEERQAELEERGLRQSLKDVDSQLATPNLSEGKRDRLESRKQLIEMRLRDFPTPFARWVDHMNKELNNVAERLVLSVETIAAKQEVERQLSDPKLTKEKRAELKRLKKSYEFVESPDRMAALFILGKWKFERHLYDKFGGGRVLWQQAGLEAFDANRKWLESEERHGHLKIADPNLRAAFYRYWTSHQNFMLEGEQEIREQFLEPKWAAKHR